MTDPIDPRTVIREQAVSALCEAAEKEHRLIKAADPTHLMALPFGKPIVAPDVLYNLGFLLAGMQIGKTMRVLDFGAGVCWLSRHLNEMGCATISLDPSPSALELGRRLFVEYPPVGGCVAEPVFLEFDGHTIELEDEAVDRIVCHAAFHHVPNPKEVLRELARVLKTGGIAGFCEPGPAHSRSEGAQLEMRTSGVLESDFVLRDIWAWAQEAGFTRIVVKPAFSPWQDLSYDDYQTIARGRRQAWRRPRLVWSVLKRHFGVLGSIAQRTNFMLHKGSAVPDSRSSWAALGGRPNSAQTRDLQHAMRADQTRYQVAAGEAVRVRVRVKNTGSVRWLHANTRDFAVVKLGAHLHDADMKLLNHDFLRAHLERDVSPGEEASLDFSFTIDGPGRYHVVLDLVSEYVAWFAQAGSDPVTLEVVVS